MHKLQIITIAMALLILAGCTKAIIDEDNLTTPVNGPVTYNNQIQAIMLNNCVTCHSGIAPSAGLDLTTYQNVRASAQNGMLAKRVEDVGNPMPPAGLLTAELRAQIAKWIADGFPEN